MAYETIIWDHPVTTMNSTTRSRTITMFRLTPNPNLRFPGDDERYVPSKALFQLAILMLNLLSSSLSKVTFRVPFFIKYSIIFNCISKDPPNIKAKLTWLIPIYYYYYSKILGLWVFNFILTLDGLSTPVKISIYIYIYMEKLIIIINTNWEKVFRGLPLIKI